MELTTDEGTHEVDERFVFDGITFELELIFTNTWGKQERDEQGYDIPMTGDILRDLEVLSATYGEDNENDANVDTLRSIEKELDKNY
jgi:hypothetical protein